VIKTIGLSGYARSGKDAVAKILVEEHGYVRVSWADKLREAVYALNPMMVGAGLGAMRYADLIDWKGYEGAKDDPIFGAEVRRTLQRMGTEAGRNVLGENVWVDALVNTMENGKRYVIPDTRFPNEALAITERMAGEVWRVNRPGFTPTNSHPSETALDGWQFSVNLNNDGTLDDLRINVHYLIEQDWRGRL
jgi:hypothetical protein